MPCIREDDAPTFLNFALEALDLKRDNQEMRRSINGRQTSYPNRTTHLVGVDLGGALSCLALGRGQPIELRFSFFIQQRYGFSTGAGYRCHRASSGTLSWLFGVGTKQDIHRSFTLQTPRSREFHARLRSAASSEKACTLKTWMTLSQFSRMQNHTLTSYIPSC